MLDKADRITFDEILACWQGNMPLSEQEIAWLIIDYEFLQDRIKRIQQQVTLIRCICDDTDFNDADVRRQVIVHLDAMKLGET
jgi:hypothetical protein